MSSATETINLVYPINVGGIETSSITIRRPLVRDMLKARNNKDEAKAELHLFSDLCQITPDEVQNLDWADYAKIQEVVKGFTSSRSGTAE
jgi:hypothetical protein